MMYGVSGERRADGWSKSVLARREAQPSCSANDPYTVPATSGELPGRRRGSFSGVSGAPRCRGVRRRSVGMSATCTTSRWPSICATTTPPPRPGVDLFRRAEPASETGRTGASWPSCAAEVEQDARGAPRGAAGRGRPAGPGAGPAAASWGSGSAGSSRTARLLRRAPLSDLIEVEGMLDAVRAKAAGWQALVPIPAPPWSDEVDTEVTYYERAMSQAERFNAIHRSVATRLFTP